MVKNARVVDAQPKLFILFLTWVLVLDEGCEVLDLILLPGKHRYHPHYDALF
jgi:hypothetical protein